MKDNLMRIEVTLKVDNMSMQNTRYLTDAEVKQIKNINEFIAMSAKELIEAILKDFHQFDGTEKPVSKVGFDVT